MCFDDKFGRYERPGSDWEVYYMGEDSLFHQEKSYKGVHCPVNGVRIAKRGQDTTPFPVEDTPNYLVVRRTRKYMKPDKKLKCTVTTFLKCPKGFDYLTNVAIFQYQGHHPGEKYQDHGNRKSKPGQPHVKVSTETKEKFKGNPAFLHQPPQGPSTSDVTTF